MVHRTIADHIRKKIFKKKAVIILGPRQSGKTTLVRSLLETINEKSIWLDGDEPDVRTRLSDASSVSLTRLIGNHKLIIIDEAQRIKNIGLAIKLITDKIPEVQVIATGSSSFELANEIKEPLTGRKYEYFLFPFSTEELISYHGEMHEERLLSDRLVFGLYPEVINHAGEEKDTLKSLTDSYLYKDILSFQGLRKPELIEKLLQAIALELCSEVSYNELAQLLGVDSQTVEKYILLLERAFVIFRLPSLSRNARNELKKARKIYFLDNGIRNAIISNFQQFSLRSDAGALWENFLVSERKKINHYHQYYCNSYFWRTMQKQEIDYIEESAGKLNAFEFKLKKGTAKLPLTFSRYYSNVDFQIINRDNYFDFITS